jgi:hypothetical protein
LISTFFLIKTSYLIEIILRSKTYLIKNLFRPKKKGNAENL